MNARIDFRKNAPDAYKAMGGLELYLRGSGLAHALPRSRQAARVTDQRLRLLH